MNKVFSFAMVCVCLGGASWAAQQDVSLPFATPYPEQLNKLQVVMRLRNNGFTMLYHETLAILSQAKDKDTTVLMGATVADLMALNTIHTSGCTIEEFERRHKICSDTTFYGSVRPYCRFCLKEAAKFCTKYLAGVLQDTLNKTEHMQQYIAGV
jgi:hypothetical protein